MKSVIISIKAFLFFSVLTGLIYPMSITGLTQIIFPGKANGSIVRIDEKAIGSELIGQKFDSVIYFSSRPSATDYNTLPSSGSNFGLTNDRLIHLVHDRRRQFISRNTIDSLTIIPSEMLFASASGLDPHISPEAAFLQAKRIAQSRNFNNQQKDLLFQTIEKQIERPQFLFLGQERVNVLLLNLEIDKIR